MSAADKRVHSFANCRKWLKLENDFAKQNVQCHYLKWQALGNGGGNLDGENHMRCMGNFLHGVAK